MVEIIHREKDLVVVNKPYGWLSERHASEKNVPEWLADELGVAPEQIYTVHRLDRTTAGLMVYALTKRGAAELSRSITDGTLKKTYTAFITADESLPRSGEMVDYLYFDRRRDKSFVVKGDRKGAKEAWLTYELMDRFTYKEKEITAARVCLETGRTHQIRVQFASRKSPLVGDGKYGSRLNYKGASLVSTELCFPWGDEVLHFAIDAKYNIQ